MNEEGEAPRRLVESPGPGGDLLRDALAERQSESLPRFTQLQQLRLRRGRLQNAAVLVAAAAAVLLVGLRSLRPAESPLTVRAEPVSLRPSAPPTASIHASPEALPALAPMPTVTLTKKRQATVKARAAAASSSSPSGEAPGLAPVMPAPAELHGGAKACAELARGGSVEPAIVCYDALANGVGVTAELALFEQARLAGKALRQPGRALSLLETYRQRFPNGSLRAEAMLAVIEWSLAAGDTARARRGVEEALASGLLGERRAELERLQASLADAPAH